MMRRHVDEGSWEPMGTVEAVAFYAAMCGVPSLPWLIAIWHFFF